MPRPACARTHATHSARPRQTLRMRMQKQCHEAQHYPARKGPAHARYSAGPRQALRMRGAKCRGLSRAMPRPTCAGTCAMCSANPCTRLVELCQLGGLLWVHSCGCAAVRCAAAQADALQARACGRRRRSPYYFRESAQEAHIACTKSAHK